MNVLLVDPDPRRGPRLRCALARHGHTVELVTEHASAVLALAGEGVDVALVCVARPGPRLWALLQHSLGVAARVPVLVLCASADSDELVECFDAGADDVVTSPVPFRELHARLRGLVRRDIAHEVLQVGGLRMDVDAHRVWRDEIELELSPRQFDLLQVFMRHPGRALSRTALREYVWDLDFRGDSNVVDQGVVQLRRRIDRPFGTAYLQTVRGVGYRLVG